MIPAKSGQFQKVGECLYRYSSNGVYYARIKGRGKEIRPSLETTDRALAKRMLAQLGIRDGRLTPQGARPLWVKFAIVTCSQFSITSRRQLWHHSEC